MTVKGGSQLKRRDGVILVLYLALAGCATTSVKPVVVAPPAAKPPPPPPPPPVVTMAPIPNPPSREAPHAAHPATSPSPDSGSTAHTAAKVASPDASPPPHNPQRATQLRAAGLEQLNRGAIQRALALLQEAAKLDPDNNLIHHDLERALRISRALSTK